MRERLTAAGFSAWSKVLTSQMNWLCSQHMAKDLVPNLSGSRRKRDDEFWRSCDVLNLILSVDIFVWRSDDAEVFGRWCSKTKIAGLLVVKREKM
jgi:hypothetical protein